MEIEKEIIKLSSCQKFLLIQSFRTMINIIDLENFRQKQVNFRQAPFSFIDYAQDELIVGGNDGKLYLKDESIQIHTGQFISGIIKDGMLLSLGEDGLLKQTNIKTLQCLYFRKLSDHIKNGQIFLFATSVLVHYDLKVVLLNLENDVIETKFKVNQQGPLSMKINNLSKDYFSILGKEGQLTIYNIEKEEPIQSIQAPLSQNYELFYMQKKITIIFWNEEGITSYVKEVELTKQYEVKINNLQAILQGNALLVVYDNVSNPKLKQIHNIEGQKFKSLYQQEQLQKFNEQQQLLQIDSKNAAKREITNLSIPFYDYTYLKYDQSKNTQQLEPKVGNNEQNMINVLKQSLIARDKVVLEYALEKTLKNGIVDSVNALELELLQELLNYLVDKLISYPELTKKYLFWVKAIVQRGVGDFSKLCYLLEERIKTTNKLEQICSKIQFNHLTNQPKQDRDYRKQAHAIYEEQESKIVIVDGKYTKKNVIEGNYAEEQTDQLEDDFNQAYNKHKQELRQQAQQEIDEEAYDNEDLKF